MGTARMAWSLLDNCNGGVIFPSFIITRFLVTHPDWLRSRHMAQINLKQSRDPWPRCSRSLRAELSVRHVTTQRAPRVAMVTYRIAMGTARGAVYTGSLMSRARLTLPLIWEPIRRLYRVWIQPISALQIPHVGRSAAVGHFSRVTQRKVYCTAAAEY